MGIFHQLGIFVVDKLMVANMELLETQKELALSCGRKGWVLW